MFQNKLILLVFCFSLLCLGACDLLSFAQPMSTPSLTSTATPTTTPTPTNTPTPTPTPIGSIGQILFETWNCEKIPCVPSIYVTNLDGSEKKQLFEQGYHLEWVYNNGTNFLVSNKKVLYSSPRDGSSLTELAVDFVSPEYGGFIGAYYNEETEQYIYISRIGSLNHISAIDKSDGSLHQITTGIKPMPLQLYPTESGKTVYWNKGTDDQSGLTTLGTSSINLDGTDFKEYTSQEFHDPIFSSSQVAYTKYCLLGESLYSFCFFIDEVTRTSEVQVWPEDPNDLLNMFQPGDYSWSPDGTKLAFKVFICERLNSTCEKKVVKVYDVITNEYIQLPELPYPFHSTLIWTPDSNQVLLNAYDEDNDDAFYYLVNISTLDYRKILEQFEIAENEYLMEFIFLPPQN